MEILLSNVMSFMLGFASSALVVVIGVYISYRLNIKLEKRKECRLLIDDIRKKINTITSTYLNYDNDKKIDVTAHKLNFLNSEIENMAMLLPFYNEDKINPVMIKFRQSTDIYEKLNEESYLYLQSASAELITLIEKSFSEHFK